MGAIGRWERDVGLVAVVLCVLWGFIGCCVLSGVLQHHSWRHVRSLVLVFLVFALVPWLPVGLGGMRDATDWIFLDFLRPRFPATFDAQFTADPRLLAMFMLDVLGVRRRFVCGMGL